MPKTLVTMKYVQREKLVYVLVFPMDDYYLPIFVYISCDQTIFSIVKMLLEYLSSDFQDCTPLLLDCFSTFLNYFSDQKSRFLPHFYF